jgi:ADP-heptose:LPS heptosyltransferase
MSREQKSMDPQKIGVFHMNQIGDLLFSLPALEALREGFPEARIVSVLPESLTPLLEGNESVDEIVAHRGSKSLLETAGALRAAELDLAVCLSESPRSRLLAWMSGAAERVGLSGGPFASLLTDQVLKEGYPSTACPAPADSYVGLLAVTPRDKEEAEAVLARARAPFAGRPLVVLASGASKGRQEKEWPRERFVEVAEEVLRNGGLPVFVGDLPAAELETDLPAGAVDLAGQTSLRALLGLLDMAGLFVGNDSGVLHLAAAVGTPSVALFGPTDPGQTGPQGTGHVVLRADPEGPAPISDLPVEPVVAAVGRMLAGPESAPLG